MKASALNKRPGRPRSERKTRGSKPPLKQLAWTPELSKSFWGDLAGSEYLERIAFSRFAAPFLVRLVRPHLEERGLVLDYGGGDNLFLVRELLRSGFRVACFEPNSNVEASNSDLKREPRYIGALSQVEADRFDAIFLSEVIEHLPDPEAGNVLRTLHSGLKSTGRLVVTTPENEDLFTASRYCPTCRTLFHPWGHVRTFTAESLESMLAEFGFQCEELHSVDFSDAREPIERAKRVSQELAAISKRLAALANSASDRITPEEREELVQTALAIDGALGSTDLKESSDPTHRRLGFGGTLVAIARKSSTGVSSCAE